MAVTESVNVAGLLSEHLESASPDVLRAMVKTFADALMSAEADVSEPTSPKFDTNAVSLKLLSLLVAALAANHVQRDGTQCTTINGHPNQNARQPPDHRRRWKTLGRRPQIPASGCGDRWDRWLCCGPW